MNPETLVAFWSAPDNGRLTSKQYTFRLPTHVAAKLHALCDVFPAKTRTQIVADLLTRALQDIDQGMPVHQGVVVGKDHDSGEDIQEACGPRILFHKLANRYFEEIERDLGNEAPERLY